MKSLALTSSIAVACLILAGCNKSAEQKADELGSEVDRAADSAGAKIENVAADADARIDNAMDRMGAAVTPVPTPQAFIDTAAKSDAFEIQAAKLAITNANSAEVKAFAQQMIKAHTDSTAKIKAAAGKLTPNPTLSKDQTEDLADLDKLTDAKFDEEYIDGQVDAHEDALALMKSFAAEGGDAALKKAAGEIAPVIDGHLKMARGLGTKTDR
jgi:putative membrane protein